MIVFGEIPAVFSKKRRFLFPMGDGTERKLAETEDEFFGYIVRKGRVDKGWIRVEWRKM